ncbi:hypothetical protein LTS17_002089 [Exophiala oligosperma]
MASISDFAVWPSLVGASTLYWLILIIYRVFFHPLATYPGPLMAKMTDWYMVYMSLTAQNTYKRYELHMKYGKVVRVGANELSYSDEASIKDIFAQSTEPCLKAPAFYKGFSLTGRQSVFSTTDRNEHGRMRRLLSHGFSQQGVLDFQPEISQIIEQYIANIATARQPVELHDETHHLFLDITSRLSFAKSFDTLSGRPHQGAQDIETYFTVCPLFGLLPIARYFPFGPFKAARQAQPRIRRSVQGYIDEFRARLGKGTTEQGLLRHMLTACDTDTKTTLTDAELVENSVLFIIAGSGTSATTVLYLLYEVSKRPEVLERLTREIRDAFPDPYVMPAFDTATKLPYLNCVLQETLRLRGPIMSCSVRLSPGKSIGGSFVPYGTTVSNVPYATARDPEAFPDPEAFVPERWETATPWMRSMNRPFSTGNRNCIGMHLARVQVLLTICALYQRFDLALDPRVTEDMMVQRDFGLMTVSGKKLWMTAAPRANSKEAQCHGLDKGRGD